MPPSRAELAAKHDRVRELARNGQSTAAIARQLGMDRRSVREIRTAAGIPSLPGGGVQPLTVEEKWRQRTRELPGGHLEWTGSTTKAGQPILVHSGTVYSVARLSFRIGNGTDPGGYAKPRCGMRHCVAPAHQVDTAPNRPIHEPRARYASPEAKLAALVEQVEGGHQRWTGSLSGEHPYLKHNGERYMAGRVAFRARYGREPDGPVTAACDYPHCLNGDHLDDTQSRRAHRAMLAAVFGR